MEISDKDKEHLVSELEKLTGTRPLFYLKFCSEEKFHIKLARRCVSDFKGCI